MRAHIVPMELALVVTVVPATVQPAVVVVQVQLVVVVVPVNLSRRRCQSAASALQVVSVQVGYDRMSACSEYPLALGV